jgi:dGTPase
LKLIITLDYNNRGILIYYLNKQKMTKNTNSLLSEQNLAPYAMKASSSKGRRYKEDLHPFRTVYQRDNARIIHSRPFRRLEYKTQVFLNGTGDHYRTRLTHTIEVSATARTIARALSLNEDLTEAISLAHDLGHTPFGHIGENVLNELLSEHGLNFEHNCHSLRIVDELITKYPNFTGLNLTWETRLGLLKHRTSKQRLDNITLPINLSLEAQAADIADDLTYYGHDIDDGLDSNLINLNDLSKLKIWNDVADIVIQKGISKTNEIFVPYNIRTLIDYMATDVIDYSSELLSKYNITDSKTPQEIKIPLITFSPKLSKDTKELKDFLYANLYRNKALSDINKKTENIIRNLFDHYSKHPDLIGKSANVDLNKNQKKLYIVISDYIAGMTDRFAVAEHDKYFT